MCNNIRVEKILDWSLLFETDVMAWRRWPSFCWNLTKPIMPTARKHFLLSSIDWWFLTSYYMKIPLCIAYFYFSDFVHPSLSPPMCSFCFVSLAECVITPNLMCYFAWWYYGPKLIKPWYLGTSSTLLCVFCNKASNLLKVWHGWHGFCLYFNLLSHIQINIPWHTGTNRLTYTHILTHLLRA